MGYAKEKPQVYLTDLHSMNDTVGSLHHMSKAEPSSAIMNGHFEYRRHCGGLSVHSSQAVELQDMSSSAELPPGLSFNFLFEGSIDFSLGGQQHRLGERMHEGVECSSIILGAPEVMTRHMKKGMRVCKVNLFVERSWLQERCQNKQQRKQLSRIFQQHSALHYWVASEKVVKLARLLLNQKTGSELAGSLHAEHLAIELLSASIEELCQVLEEVKPSEALLITKNSHLLKQLIDENLDEHYSLNDIAGQLNVSASTLQRKFKAAYGITVIDYVRQRRLELAKTALTIGGVSVGEAAYLAGYHHSSNFVSAFKKRFLMTPSAMVKSHRR